MCTIIPHLYNSLHLILLYYGDRLCAVATQNTSNTFAFRSTLCTICSFKGSLVVSVFSFTVFKTFLNQHLYFDICLKLVETIAYQTKGVLWTSNNFANPISRCSYRLFKELSSKSFPLYPQTKTCWQVRTAKTSSTASQDLVCVCWKVHSLPIDTCVTASPITLNHIKRQGRETTAVLKTPQSITDETITATKASMTTQQLLWSPSYAPTASSGPKKH